MELEGRGSEVDQVAFSFLLSETAVLWNLISSAGDPVATEHCAASINCGQDGCPSAPQGEHRVLDPTEVSRKTVHLCRSRAQGWEEEAYIRL